MNRREWLELGGILCIAFAGVVIHEVRGVAGLLGFVPMIVGQVAIRIAHGVKPVWAVRP